MASKTFVLLAFCVDRRDCWSELDIELEVEDVSPGKCGLPGKCCALDSVVHTADNKQQH